MTQSLVAVSLLVPDYDEAIEFFMRALRCQLVEDTPLGGDKRWVVVGPKGPGGARLLLARAATDAQRATIGNQAGGRVFLFLHTSDFWSDYRHMQAQGVRFIEAPRDEPYGLVAVFLDLYGNKWDLIQLARSTRRVRRDLPATSPGRTRRPLSACLPGRRSRTR